MADTVITGKTVLIDRQPAVLYSALGDLSADLDGDGLNDETGEPVPTQQYRQFYNIPR